MKNKLQKNTIFLKLKSWWYNLTHKNSKSPTDPLILQDDIHEEITSKQMPFAEYRQLNERQTYLIELQKKFENKEILEKDIEIQDKNDLEKLYREQINNLKREIKNFEKKLQV